MSGIELKKNDNSKKRQTLKFVICLISSNLFVLFLFSFFSGKDEEIKKETFASRPYHQGYEKLQLHLETQIVFTPNDQEISASLYSEDKKILVPQVFLHPDESEEMPKEQTSFKEDKTDKKYIVEIPKDSLHKLIHYKGEKLLAYPATLPQEKRHLSQSQGASYEITF